MMPVLYVIYNFFRPNTPVYGLFIICTNFCQCRSPASTTDNSQLHVVNVCPKCKERKAQETSNKTQEKSNTTQETRHKGQEKRYKTSNLRMLILLRHSKYKALVP